MDLNVANYKIEELMRANSILSFPYYVFLIFWEGEVSGIVHYFDSPTNPLFLCSFLLAILLAFASEYTGIVLKYKANTISMKISPFEKASVSNIKDLILTIVSVQYFKDLEMTSTSLIGVVLCLSASLVFSLTLLVSEEKEEITKENYS